VGLWRKRWARIATAVLAVPAILFVAAAAYYFVRFS